MAFKKVGTLSPYGGPVLRHVVLQNSDVFTENDMTKTDSSGFLTTDSIAGAGLFGHVEALVDGKGVGLTDNGSGGDFSGTYTAASDNQTVAEVSARVDISQQSLYSVAPDATIGTTTGSDLLGYYIDAADEDNTDEDTAASSTAQFYIWGVDPVTSANHIVNIFESEVFSAA